MLTKRGNSLSRYILIGKTDSEFNNFPLWEFPQLINDCWIYSVDSFQYILVHDGWGLGTRLTKDTIGKFESFFFFESKSTVNTAWWMDCKTKGIVDDLTLAWLPVRMLVDSSDPLIVMQLVSVLDHHWSQRSPIGDDTPPLSVLQNTRNSWYHVTQCYETLVCILIGILLFWYQLVVIFFFC